MLDTGADTSIADERFLKNIGLKREDLSKINEHRIRGATQAYFKQLGTIRLQISYGSNSIEDVITMIDGNLAVLLLIRWNVTITLRKNLHYPKTLNQVERTQLPSERGNPRFRATSGDVGNFIHRQEKNSEMTIHMKQDEIPTYMREIPDDPNDEQIENVKQKMIAEFQDVFSEEEKH